MTGVPGFGHLNSHWVNCTEYKKRVNKCLLEKTLSGADAKKIFGAIGSNTVRC